MGAVRPGGVDGGGGGVGEGGVHQHTLEEPPTDGRTITPPPSHQHHFQHHPGANPPTPMAVEGGCGGDGVY